jgi:RNA polymerase sigma factor (sigma-70 family)
MSVREHTDEFARYERLLWRVLSSLSRHGYFVPPDDARDVMHDFYLEAWSGLHNRFDADLASFPTYLSASFYRFARRRLIRMDSWKRRIVSLDVIEEPPSDEPSPSEAYEIQERQVLISYALNALAPFERDVLSDYLTDSNASERKLAVKHAMTRYAVRETLATAIGQLARLLNRNNGAVSSRIALQLWEEGRSLHQAATYLNISITEVQRHKAQLSIDVMKSLRTLEKEHSAIRGDAMPSQLARLKAQILSTATEPSSEFLALIKSIRETPEELEALEFSPTELDHLRAHPEMLAVLYDALAGAQAQNEDELHIEKLLAAARREEEVEIAEAFAAMTNDLPSDLLEWHRHFPQLEVDAEYLSYLLEQVVVKFGGDHAQMLARHGMTPVTIAAALRTLQLLLDDSTDESNKNIQPRRFRRQVGRTHAKPSTLNVTVAQATAQIRTTPWLPQTANAPEALTRWLIQALSQRPYLIRGYEFITSANSRDRLTFIKHDSADAEPADLMALWTRPAKRYCSHATR